MFFSKKVYGEAIGVGKRGRRNSCEFSERGGKEKERVRLVCLLEGGATKAVEKNCTH